ncbi:MAG TPA: hypothetical protein VNR60_01555 [Croceibacterium sp.]|nr:hypothetical protein [Croceibacterium sp.]
MATERKTSAGGTARPPAASKNPRKKSVRITPTQREEGGETKANTQWRTYFLQALAETSNVTSSAERAGISASRAYKARREDADFRAVWSAALLEGYEHLEMEVLGYLRTPDPAKKLDVGSAIRLISLHRETIASERARAGGRDEQSVLDSIDAMIDRMRERRAAHAETAGASDARR